MFFGDIHGRSIAYARSVWGKHARYPDLSLAEDARFLQVLRRLQNVGRAVVAAGGPRHSWPAPAVQ